MQIVSSQITRLECTLVSMQCFKLSRYWYCRRLSGEVENSDQASIPLTDTT